MNGVGMERMEKIVGESLWHHALGSVLPLRLGHLTCFPALDGDVVAAWIVPFSGEALRMPAASRLGGAPVWLVADYRSLGETSAFEACYWGVGLAATGADSTVRTVVEPTTIRPAGARERSTVAAYGWRFADEF